MSLKFLNSLFILLTGLFFTCLQGCDVNLPEVQQTSNPYPNARMIQVQIKSQINLINADLQNGTLGPDMASVLKDNDMKIHWLGKQDQNVVNPPQDLDPGQTAALTLMLNDNTGMMNDALANTNAWNQSFQGGWDLGYVGANPNLVQCYLDIHIRRQQARLDKAVQSGQLTPDQAQDINERLQIVRNNEVDDYRQNGRLLLSGGQIQDLRQMTDDNYRYMDFRDHDVQSAWSDDRYGNWNVQYSQQSNTYVSGWNPPPAWVSTASRPQGNYPPHQTVNPAAGTSTVQVAAQEAQASYPPPRIMNQTSATPNSQAPAQVQVPAQASNSVAAPTTPSSTSRPPWQTQPGNNAVPANSQIPARAPGTTAIPFQSTAPVAQAPAPKPAPAQPSKAPASNSFVNPDALKTRSQAQDQIVVNLVKSAGDKRIARSIQNMRNIYKQTLNAYFSQNKVKKLTQAQADSLNKKMDQIDQSIKQLQDERSDQGSSGETKGDRPKGHD